MPSRLFLRAVSLTLAPEPMVSFLEKSLMCCLRQQGTRKRVLINPLQLERNVTAYESDVKQILMQPLFNPGNTITVNNQRHIVIQATDANVLVTYNTETHQIKAISQTLATKPLLRHGYQPLEAVTENEWATIRNIETNLRLEFTGTDCGDARTFIAFSEQVAKG